MSRKTRGSERQRDQTRQLALRRRRWFLALHILFQVLVVAGSQGLFYTAYQGEEELFSVSGPEFAARMRAAGPAPEPSDGIEDERSLGVREQKPREVYEPGFLEKPGRVASLAMLAAIVAFFFLSFDLVSDKDIQAPALVASAVVCVAAALALNSIYAPQNTLLEIVEQVEGQRTVPLGEVAAVDSSSGAAALLTRLPRIRLGWGASLLISAAPLMLVLSVYLTFFAVRTPESP